MFETEETFQKKIYILREKTKQSLIETMIQFCEERAIEYESIAPLVSGKLKSDLREEFEQLNFLPKTRKISNFLSNAR